MEIVVTAACIVHESWQILLSQMLDMVLLQGTHEHKHTCTQTLTHDLHFSMELMSRDGVYIFVFYLPIASSYINESNNNFYYSKNNNNVYSDRPVC